MSANASDRELKGLLRQCPENLLFLAFKKVLLARVTTGPVAQCIAGRLVFEPQGVQVVRKSGDGLVHGTDEKISELLQDRTLP